MNKESDSLLQYLARDGYAFKSATLTQQNDPEYVLAAIKGSAGHALKFASKERQDDESIVRAATEVDYGVFDYASPRLKSDKEFIQTLAAKWPQVLRFASAELKDDGELILSVTKPDYYESLLHASSRLKGDKEFVLDIVSICGATIRYASDELKKDTKVVLAAVAQGGYDALKHVHVSMMADKNVIKAAAAKSPTVLHLVSDEFKDDEEVILLAITEHNYIGLYYASERLKGDKEFVLKVVSICGNAIQNASDELKKDKEVALAAVFKSGYHALCHVSVELRGDKDILLQALELRKNSYEVLRIASAELKDDADVVHMAVEQDGYALSFASVRLQSDKDVVLTAVAQNGMALRFASEELQSDKDVVLTAVAQNGSAIKFASDEHRGDKDTVCKAVTQDWTAIEYASPKLKVNTDVLLIVMSQSRGILNPYADTFYKSCKPENIDALRSSIKTFDRTMYDLHYARKEVRALLLSSGSTKVPKTLNGCAISKLYNHGPHFATTLKRRIASFVGIPDHPSWYITCGGKDGPYWTLFDSVIEDVLKRIGGCGEEVFQYLPPKPFTRL